MPGRSHLSPFHVMAKPTGAICNLDCAYCFYVSKQAIYPGSGFRMSRELLEAYVRQMLEAHGPGDVVFAWQGGEPTLLGREFFEEAVALAERLRRPGQRPLHCIQTNGVLLDRDWARFFRQHEFLVGVSLDGPRALHDAYRVDKRGAPTFERVMRGIASLRSAGVQWNVLATLHRANAPYPREVYRFLRDVAGARYIQFIPIVEREGAPDDAPPGPPPVRTGAGQDRVLYMQRGDRAGARSIAAADYGRFLAAVFDEWAARDIGRVSVQAIDAACAAWSGLPPPLCVFAPTCGGAVALEHNGDVYSCDHYVEPGYRLGNVARTTLREMVDSPRQRRFGQAKRDTLPTACRSCEYRFACEGGCPKDRFVARPGEALPGNYLCEGYRAFFRHIDRPMRTICRLAARGLPGREIMNALRQPG